MKNYTQKGSKLPLPRGGPGAEPPSSALSGALQAEKLGDPRIVPVPKPRQRLIAQDIEHAVHHAVVAQMDADDFAEMVDRIKKVGVLHFGDALLTAVVEEGLASNIGDLYALTAAEVGNLMLDGRRVGGAADRAGQHLGARGRAGGRLIHHG